MSVAWTTILIIALLLPGVLFFIGLHFEERFSREIIRSNAIGEVGLAILVALTFHFFAYWVLLLFGFDLAEFLGPLTTHDQGPDLHSAARIIVRGGFYTIVTAYVMTTTAQNNQSLMYTGVLSEFYLTVDGSLTYVILKNCSRFFMKMDGEDPITTAKLKLFGSAQESRQSWDYLFIDAKNIANVLFDPSPEIKTSDRGTQALDRALADLKAAGGATGAFSAGASN
jgi:hypothetical protein